MGVCISLQTFHEAVTPRGDQELCVLGCLTLWSKVYPSIPESDRLHGWGTRVSCDRLLVGATAPQAALAAEGRRGVGPFGIISDPFGRTNWFPASAPGWSWPRGSSVYFGPVAIRARRRLSQARERAAGDWGGQLS